MLTSDFFKENCSGKQNNKPNSNPVSVTDDCNVIKIYFLQQ